MNSNYDNISERPAGRIPHLPMILMQIATFFCAFVSGYSAAPISFVLAIFSNAMIGAMLVFCPKIYCFAGVVLGFIAAGAFNFTPFVCVLPIMFVLPVLTDTICLKKRLPRINTALIGAVGYIITAALIVVIILIMSTGTVSLQSLKDLINGYIDSVASDLERIFDGELASMGQMSAFNAAAVDAESFKQLLSRLVLMLPGFCAVGCFASAYAQTAVLRGMLKPRGALELLYPDGWYPDVSAVSAVMFILTFIAGSFAGTRLSVFAVAVSALQLFFELMFAIVGFSMTVRFFAARSMKKSVAVALIAIAFLLAGAIISAVLMIVGVIGTIKGAVRNLKKN